jgi:hypothetical protein
MTKILSERIKEETRTLVHNIRGSIGIVNSSIELLNMEDISETGMKMLSMISRQSARMLAEFELFSEMYAPREITMTGSGSDILQAIYDAAEAVGVEILIKRDPKMKIPEILIPLSVLKTVFSAILLKPSPIENNYRFFLKIKDQKLLCTFKYPEDFEPLLRHNWIIAILPNYGASLKLDNGNGRFSFKIV